MSRHVRSIPGADPMKLNDCRDNFRSLILAVLPPWVEPSRAGQKGMLSGHPGATAPERCVTVDTACLAVRINPWRQSGCRWPRLCPGQHITNEQLSRQHFSRQPWCDRSRRHGVTSFEGPRHPRQSHPALRAPLQPRAEQIFGYIRSNFLPNPSRPPTPRLAESRETFSVDTNRIGDRGPKSTSTTQEKLTAHGQNLRKPVLPGGIGGNRNQKRNIATVQHAPIRSFSDR